MSIFITINKQTFHLILFLQQEYYKLFLINNNQYFTNIFLNYLIKYQITDIENNSSYTEQIFI